MRSRARGYLSELRRATCPEESRSSFCPPSSPLNFLRLLPTFPPPPPLAQTELPIQAKSPSLLWHGFSSSHFQSFLVFAFLSFHLEEIFWYSHTQEGKPLDSPASFRPISLASCVSKLFERIILSRLLFFLESNFILSLPARPVSALDRLLWIKFFIFLNPFGMGLKPGFRTILATLGFSKAFDSVPPFSTNSFRLASVFALLVGLNLSFLISALAWFIKITKVAPFESIQELRKDPFLALYFSLSSLMIFLPLCLLSAAFFMQTIWPFSPPPPRSPLRWRPHKELCFDWSAGLSTGVFLSIRANVRPPSSQWIPTKLTSSPTSSYSTAASVSIPLQLFLGSPSITLFPFVNMYLC